MRLMVLAGLMALPVAAAAQSPEFSWHQKLAAGKTIEIKGINGSISATAASGDEVQVAAVKHARRSDPASVEIKVVPSAQGVTICAVYPSPAGRSPNTCEPGDGGRMNSQNNDVTVDFTVRVPASVRFSGRTVNGSVSARGLQADAEAATVNGDIDVESGGGVARGTTVNGSIEAVVGRADWDGVLDFSTVNGAVNVSLPADANVSVDGSTVNGDIDTEFPLTIRGKWGPRHVSGTIGSGGHELKLATVNGSITIKKR